MNEKGNGEYHPSSWKTAYADYRSPSGRFFTLWYVTDEKGNQVSTANFNSEREAMIWMNEERRRRAAGNTNVFSCKTD